MGEEGLPAHASSFTRRDVLRAWAERLPTGASVEQVEWLADALLDENSGRVVGLDFVRRLDARDVIRRGDGTVLPAERGERRYSTTQLLALERHALELADRRGAADIAVVDQAVVDEILRRRPTIGADQARMVHRLASSGAGVDVVIGKAGAGKTFALDAAREGLAGIGPPGAGCSSARAAGAGSSAVGRPRIR